MLEGNRFFIETAFRGSHYHGWQIQDNALSIQGILEKAFQTLLRRPIHLTGCGRTDTGVHALQHFAHFDDQAENFGEAFIHQLNSILPEDISVKTIFGMHTGSHARFDALSRIYYYRLYFQKNPFFKGLSSFCPYVPNVEAMQEAAQVLQSYSNFSSFSKAHTQVKTNICTILNAHWHWEAEELVFVIEADRFLRNMVRAIVGTLLRVGWGEITLKDFRNIIESGDRNKAGASVSPDGLYLKKITYPYSLPNSPLALRTKTSINSE